LVEYKKAIEPVQTLSIHKNKVTIVNRYDFLTLDHLVCTWRVVLDGFEISGHEAEIPKGRS
jgi:beta-galactosidase